MLGFTLTRGTVKKCVSFSQVITVYAADKWHIKSLELLILDATHTRLLVVMCDGSKVAISRRYQSSVKALFRGAM